MADAARNLDAPPPTQFDAALDFGVRGVPGLRQSGGLINEERLSRLMGRKLALLIREITDNSPIVGFVLRSMKTWIQSVDWSVEAASDKPVAQMWAWFIESCMDDMSHTWEDFCWQGLSHIDNGWCLFEICYKRRLGDPSSPLTRSKHKDGYIGWRKFALRSQDTLDRWQFDEYGSLSGMWQTLPEGSVFNQALRGRGGRFYIPLQKALLFRLNGYNDSPEGRTILRNGITSYLDARRISDIEMIGVERDLVGLPDMQLPVEFFAPNAPQWMIDARLMWKQVVSLVRRDELEGVTRPCENDREGKPTGYKFGLLSSGGERQLDIDKIIRRKEGRICLSMLADFCLVGIEQGGGMNGGGVVDSKKDAFSLSLDAIPRNMAAVINKYAIEPLCKLNGCPQEFIPKIRHTAVSAPSLTEMAQFISSAASAGMLMYDVATERRLREMSGLPQRDETELGGNQITGMAIPQTQTTAQEAEGSGIPAQDTSPLLAGSSMREQGGVVTNVPTNAPSAPASVPTP